MNRSRITAIGNKIKLMEERLHCLEGPSQHPETGHSADLMVAAKTKLKELKEECEKLKTHPQVGEIDPSRLSAPRTVFAQNQKKYVSIMQGLKFLLQTSKLSELVTQGATATLINGIAQGNEFRTLDLYADGNGRKDIQFARSGLDTQSNLRFIAYAITPGDMLLEKAGVMKFKFPAPQQDCVLEWALSAHADFCHGVLLKGDCSNLKGSLIPISYSTDHDFPTQLDDSAETAWFNIVDAIDGAGIYNRQLTGQIQVTAGSESCLFLGLRLFVTASDFLFCSNDSMVETLVGDQYLGFPPDWPDFRICAEDLETGEMVPGVAFRTI